MAALTKTDICNMAIQRGLGQNTRLTNVDTDDTTVSRACAFAYDKARLELLENYNWSFAIKRVELAQLVTTPEFEWSYEYGLPNDYLRIITTYRNPDWVVEGAKFLTNQDSDVFVRYMADIEDTSIFPRMFSNAMAYLIALDIEPTITNDQAVNARVAGFLTVAIQDAKRKGGIERRRGKDNVPDPSWVTRGRTTGGVNNQRSDLSG